MKDRSCMALRYYLPLESHRERFAYLKDFLQRTGIRRVMLFSNYFIETGSFTSVEYYREHAKMLSEYIPQLRGMGVGIEINMLYTVGHMYYPRDGEFDFDRCVEIDGNESESTACSLDDRLHAYIREIYTLYAQLKPDRIHIDDDLRSMKLAGPACFCDKHLKLLSEKVGRSVTREEVRQALCSDGFEKNELRIAALDMLQSDLVRVIRTVTETVHAVSPGTEIGVMTGGYPLVALDRDLHEFFRKVQGMGVSSVRLGMTYYRDSALRDVPYAFSNPMIQRSLIDNDAISLQPEIENDIYTFMNKSNATTDLQMVWCLSNGFKNMQLNLFSSVDTVLEDYDSIVGLFEKHMPLYNKISELIPEGKRTGGVAIPRSCKTLKVKRVKGGLPDLMNRDAWYNWLLQTGFPIGYDWDAADHIVLEGDDVLAFSDEMIDCILKKGALLDARAAECLLYRGYGERIGIEKAEPLKREFFGEVFTDEAENGKYRGAHDSDYLVNVLVPPDAISEITYRPGARQLSYIIDRHKNKVAPGVTLYENKQGERFCIVPYGQCFWFDFTMITYKKREQLSGALEWIAGGKRLPVLALNALTAVNINESEDKNVITLFNCSYDKYSSQTLRYSVRGRLSVLTKTGKKVRVPYETQGENIVIRRKLSAADSMVLIDEF